MLIGRQILQAAPNPEFPSEASPRALQPRPGLPWAVVLTLAGLATASGCASLWIITEQDIYWQIRAGLELWQTHQWPTVDSWSFSAAGQPWMNLQWLSTLIFAAAFAAGGETALILLRGALVALLMLILGTTLVLTGRQRSTGQQLAALGALLPAAFAALIPRVQLRSDFLVLVVFAGLLLLWSGPWSAGRQRWGTPLAVLLAANLHAGCAPFVLACALTLLASRGGTPDHPWRRTGAAMGASALVYLGTPYHLQVIPWAWAHVFYYSHSVMQNPDHQPFTAAYAQTPAGIAWLVLAVAAALAWFVPGASRASWRQRAVGAAFCLVLVALSCNRTRAIPYHVVFCLPAIASGLWLLPTSLAAAPSILVGSLLALLATQRMESFWRFGVSESLFPIGSTRFIEANQPARNLLHTFAYGAYLVWYLRDYPLYVDTRETMYWSLQQEILNAYHSPEITQALIQKYHVNTTLMPIPKTEYIRGMGFRDLIAEYMPSADWAVVYFDAISFVTVRRIPEHAAIIAAHEYRLLRPNLPANSYGTRRQRTPQSDAQYASELQRCRTDEPTNAFCMIAQATFWRTTDPLSYHLLAENLLTTAQGQLTPQSPQYLTLMVELQTLYQTQGLPEKAAAIDRLLGPSTVLQQ